METNQQTLDEHFKGGIYRYRPDNTHTIDEIKDGYIYFQKREKLNDPFDCSPYLLNVNNESETLKKYAFDLLKRQGNSRQQARKIVRDTNMDEFKANLNSSIFDQVSKLRIACFSHQPSNLMLWSHYASGHKGLCLHFLPSLDIQTFGTLHDVNYKEKFESVNFTPGELLSQESLKHLIYTKSKVWEMEQELRLFDFDDKDKRYFKIESLRSIVFGFESSASLKKEVFTLCNQPKYKHIKIFQARPRNDEFGINLDLIGTWHETNS